MSRNPLPGLTVYQYDDSSGYSVLLGEHDNRYRMIRDIADRAVRVLESPGGRAALGDFARQLVQVRRH